MNHKKMRYKGFEFDINPTDITVKSKAMTREIAVPFNSHIIQELGYYPKHISGKGIFTGEKSVRKYAELESIFKEGGRGMLYISGAEPMTAVMTCLEFNGKSGQSGISYYFEFVQCCEEFKDKNAVRLHTVKKGETLFHIANKYGVSVEKLMSLNPKIPAPFEIKENDEVRLN